MLSPVAVTSVFSGMFSRVGRISVLNSSGWGLSPFRSHVALARCRLRIDERFRTEDLLSPRSRRRAADLLLASTRAWGRIHRSIYFERRASNLDRDLGRHWEPDHTFRGSAESQVRVSGGRVCGGSGGGFYACARHHTKGLRSGSESLRSGVLRCGPQAIDRDVGLL